MKTSIKKSNKRTETLKTILERIDNVATVDSNNQTISAGDTTENLVKTTKSGGNASVITFNEHKSNDFSSNGANITTSTTQSIRLFHDLIKKELAKVAAGLGINELELKAWIDLQIDVPARTILSLLRSIQSLHLDPLSEEIGFTQYEDGQWQVLITIEGCSKLLNQHPQFNGLVFNQAETLIDGLPEWIECSIYRKDRAVPTTVREYLIEVRSENAIWQKLPRRMLRHRALQQCVRLVIA